MKTPARLTPHSALRTPRFIEPLEARIAPAVVVLNVDSLATDVDADGVADPGDRIHYTVTVQNTGPGDVTGLTFQEILNNPALTLVANSINVSPLAFNDSYTAVGNTTLRVGNLAPLGGPFAANATKVLANDTEFLGDSFVISAFDATSAQGGTVIMVTSGAEAGSFNYLPAVGFTGTDTFTYTLRDDGIDGIAGNADDLTGVGTVTIAVANKVWYVDNTAAAGGTGRSNAPFDSLVDVTGATGPDGAGDIIFVHTGNGNYTGGITLLNNQTLWGANEPLVVGGFALDVGTTLGTDPVITNATGNGVTVANGATLKGFRVGNTSGFDISNTTTSPAGTVNISNVVLSGTGGLLNFDATTTLNATFESMSTTSASANGINLVNVGGSLSVVAGGSTTMSVVAGTSVNVSNSAVNINLRDLGLSVITGAGVVLTNHTGSFDANANFQSVAGNDVSVVGGSGNVTISGTINNGSGGAVNIDNHDAGNVTISADITGSGGTGINVVNNGGGTILFSGATKTLNTGASDAVTLTGNTGATINFTGGGLDIDTTSGAGFTATGGGTVTVQGANNSITSGSGTALNVANTFIGASGLNFVSIAANGAANGIVLNNTGTTAGTHGGLTITGDGGSANNSSGGTIQNTTGHGISLTSTRAASLDQMNIQSTGGSGINGTGVVNFTFTNGTINNSGNAVGEGNIALNGNGTLLGNSITGTLTITGSTLTNAFDSGIEVQQSDGTIADAVITGNTITSTTSTATSKGSGVKVILIGTASTVAGLAKATISNNVITNFPSDAGIEVKGGNTAATGPAGILGTPGSGTNIISITGNQIAGQSVANKMGTSFIDIGLSGGNAAARSQANFNVSNNGTAANPMTNTAGFGISVGNTGYATMTLTTNNNRIVANNTVGSAGIGGGNGIVTSTAETPDLTWNIVGNNISATDGNGILAVARGVTSTMKVKIVNNTVAAPLAGVRPGIRVDAGNATSVDDAVFLEISGNTSGGSGGHEGIGLRKQGTTPTVNDFVIRGMTATSSPGVEQYVGNTPVTGQNPGSASGSFGAAGVLLISATSGFTNWTGAGGQPPFNPLMFAPSVEEPAPASEEPVVVAPPAIEPPVVVTEPVVEPPVVVVVQPPVIVDDGILSQAELDSLVNAAIARWAATGLSAEQVSLLQSVVFSIEDLPGWYLGSAGDRVVTLDVNAAGNQWFVDPTPLEDAEFVVAGLNEPGGGTQLVATGVNDPGYNRVDALTTILHELGHQLGLDDTYAAADSSNLMYGWLTSGERRVPAAGQAAGVVAGLNEPGHSRPDFLFGAMNLGTLPANKTLTIVYDATINNLTNGLAPVINSQVRIIGSGGVNVLSDDPAVGGAADPTATPLDTLTLGNLVWNDLNKDGDIDAGEPGVTGVVLNLFADTNADGSFTPGTDTFVATTTTAGSGQYSFTNLLPGEYLVQVAALNFNAGGALATLTLSSPGSPDPDTNINNDDNGALLAGQGAVSAAITLAYNTEPTAGPGNDDNNTLDFGFTAPVVDLSVTKTNGVTSSVPGAQTTYTIVVTNLGPDGANGATFTDTFPAIFTGATWTAQFADGATGNANGAGNINQLVNLPSGATVTYTVVGTVAAAATGSLANTATIAAPAGVNDTNPGNNSATDTDTLTPQADLTITKTDNRTTIPAGFASSYVIVVRNTGPSAATGATVADTFPANFTGATWSTVVTGGATATANGVGNLNDTVNLPAGSTITYTVNGTIALAATGTLTNTATVTAPGTVTDTTPANNTATDTTGIVVVPDLRVTIDNGVNATTPGAALTYALTFSNAGPAAAAGVGISVPLPAGTTFDAAANAGWTIAGSTLKFSIGNLGSGASGNATLKLTVKDPVPVGLFTLTATATIADDGANGADATPADNTDTDLDALPLLQLANGGKTALYLDADGDLVTLKTTKGTFALGDFTIRAAGLGIIVERLLLAGDPAFADTTLTWTAKPQPGNRGDGIVNVGAIDATGLNLKGVKIPGDLGQIDAGSGVAKPAALGALTVHSLGRFGLATQNAGLTPSLTSDINGPLGKLAVKTDIDGAFINVTGANGTVGSVNVGRSLVGGAANNSGSIQSAQTMGTVKIGGHLLGGGGLDSGALRSLTTIKSVNVGGALLGGGGPNSGAILGAQSLGAINVKSDLVGSNFGSGAITSLGAIKSVTVGGSLLGGATGSGSIFGASIGNVTIASNVEGGFFGATGILATTTIGAVKIGGDVNSGLGQSPLIVAGGVLNPASAKEALAIKSVSIGGSVRGLNLLAGYDTNFTAINADAAIGAVSVKGDWSSSNLIAGIERGGDGMFGTDDDFVFGGGEDADLLASVASISIGGVARGAAGGPLVFLAEKVGAFKTGTTAMPLTADFDDLIVGTNGIRLRELNAATAPDPTLNPVIPVSVLTFFNDNKTATFTDTDGDLVTIKTSQGDLSLAGVLTFGAGGNGGQLQLINLTGLADFEGANLAITAKRTADGGNGFVDVGAIRAGGINLGNVSIAGDLGQIDAGNTDPVKPAIASLTVQSLGAAGTNTQLPGGDLKSETRGALGKLVVKSDIVSATVHVGGGQNGATNDGPLGKLGSVSIGRSLLGGQDDTGRIYASGTLGKVTIGGDVRGSVGDRSGTIRADGAMGDVRIGGSVLGSLGADSGSIAGASGVGNVTIKQSLRGGGDDRAGSVIAFAGNLKGVKIGGHLVGGSDDFTGSILSAAGAIGNVSIAGSLLALADDRTGIFSDATIGAIKIGGDVLGGGGFTAKISAEGIAAPATAAKAVALKSLDIGGVARFVRVLAGFDVNGAAANADVQIGSVKVKGDWLTSSVSAGVDPTNPNFGDGDDVSILAGGNADIASRIGAIVIGGQAAGTFAAGDSYAFTAQQLGSIKVGKSAFKLGKKPTDPLDNIAIGITLDLAAREVV